MLALAEHEPALLRRRRLAKQGAEHVRLHLHEILHLFERVEVRIHAHTVAVDPIEIARMVGMGMRQDDLDGVPGSPEGVQRLVKRLLACRVVEANVDDRSRLVSKDDVGVQRLQGVMACNFLVAPTGFEPATSALRGRRPKPLDDGAT